MLPSGKHWASNPCQPSLYVDLSVAPGGSHALVPAAFVTRHRLSLFDLQVYKDNAEVARVVGNKLPALKEAIDSALA